MNTVQWRCKQASPLVEDGGSNDKCTIYGPTHKEIQAHTHGDLPHRINRLQGKNQPCKSTCKVKEDAETRVGAVAVAAKKFTSSSQVPVNLPPQRPAPPKYMNTSRLLADEHVASRTGRDLHELDEGSEREQQLHSERPADATRPDSSDADATRPDSRDAASPENQLQQPSLSQL